MALLGELALAQPSTDKPIGILLAAGDISTCGKCDQEPWHCYANKTAEIIRKVIEDSKNEQPPMPVHILALGDLAYGEGTAEQFRCFQERWRDLDDVLLPVPGNHEYKTENAAPYFAHFKNNLFVNQNGEQKGYFALNFPRADGPWRLIGLNAHIRGEEAMHVQMEWLKEKLDIAKEGNKQDCVLAFWHAPTFSSGRHGHDYKTEPKTPLTKARPMQAALRILYDNGASVVLAGHDHNYEQFSPHDPEGKPAQDGIRSFVVGTGGSLLTEDIYNNMAPNSEGLYGRTKGMQGVLKIELFEKRYSWEFLQIDKKKLPREQIDKKKLPLKTTAGDCTKRRKPAE
jgi:3',5'-cyclic AMP phosphodiesterase CpdA